VFLGQVREAKGVGTLLEAARRLSTALSVDIYGPLYEPYSERTINERGQGKVRYKGVLSTEEVERVLFEYDALALPTFHETEGYPAVVLEAYSHGLPVVTTRWRAIPEIVDDTSGILIAPHAPGELADAMNRLHQDPELFERLQLGARHKSPSFSSRYWTNRFVEVCQACLPQ
jgi:glycosyltransferase involved in cell wall biosynthesis